MSEASIVRHTSVAGESARSRPRVLHLIDSFEIGGTERQAVELLKRLDRERYDVRLAVLRKGGPFFNEIEPLFPVVPEFPLNSFYDANAVKQLARLCALMLRERIDILHAHDFYSGFIGSAGARLVGVKVIACQRHLKLSNRRVHLGGTRAIHRLAHRILVNSQAIREKIVEHDTARAEKIVVINNGVEIAEPSAPARDELRCELGLASNVKLIGMVARLQEVKGHRFFIEAAARISRSGVDAHFVLVGDGPLRSEIEKQIDDLGITTRVHLLGDRTDVARLVSAFDLLVLASLHEGLPNAVMEAMAAGVPVVATAVGGAKELILDGETGYLAPPSNAAALAERIAFALGDETERVRITNAARNHIAASFGMERMVESVERLYDELMENM
ncbi:MAG TPA: glycosyltransferase [Blastocatellia bacterium]|nr:glycosyltransferase [Blastocatellia bacterium]